MKMLYFFFLYAFLGLTVEGTNLCDRCENFHPQPIICQSDFVGIVKVTKVDLENTINLSPTNNVTAEIQILEVFKGARQDFVEGSFIYLYASDDQSCQRKYWKEDILITGMSFNGGLLSTKCDLREARSILRKSQLETIVSHIRNHAYEQGCRSCSIKRPYDHSSAQSNECRYPFYEFPISTAACMLSEATGRCRIVRNSRQQFRLPDQPELPTFRDFDGRTPNQPQERGCLLDRIASEASKQSRPAIEEGTNATTTSVPKTTTSIIVSSKNSSINPIIRMSINWSKRKPRRPRT